MYKCRRCGNEFKDAEQMTQRGDYTTSSCCPSCCAPVRASDWTEEKEND